MDCPVPRRGGFFSLERFFVGGFCIPAQRRAERQAASQRFGDCDHIRQHTVVLISKVASRAAEAALNLIEHKQRAALFGQPRGEFEKLRIDRTNSALSLNGLDTYCTDAGIE